MPMLRRSWKLEDEVLGQGKFERLTCPKGEGSVFFIVEWCKTEICKKQIKTF
jgi:hypothetical protein